MKEKKQKLLSVVIPVFNEVKTLEEIIRRVLAVDVPLEKELIVIDDGSTDGSNKVMKRLGDLFPDAPLQCLFHENNLGKGAALRTGFAQTKGDIVLVQDADLEYDPQDYPHLLAPILDGRADVVFGTRFIGSEAHRVLHFWHMIGNKMLTFMSNTCSDLNLTDMEACYKVFRGDLIRSIPLVSNRFEFEPEITARLAGRRVHIYEVGISYAGRDYDEGKKTTWVDGVKAIAAIIRFNLFSRK